MTLVSNRFLAIVNVDVQNTVSSS